MVSGGAGARLNAGVHSASKSPVTMLSLLLEVSVTNRSDRNEMLLYFFKVGEVIKK